MPADTVTLAQISDVHLGPLPPIPLRLLNLKRITGFLNWHRKRRFMHRTTTANLLAADVVAQQPTHIAVTGDLANIGLPSEIERAAVWMQRLGSPDIVSVIPCNHDIYSTIDGRNVGIAALSTWQPYMTPNAEGARYGDPSTPFPFVRVVRQGTMAVALIGLNSAVETPPLIAIGRLGDAQLKALAGILDATRNDQLVRVVMLHHPPFPGGAGPRHELTDAAALADLLDRHGAELVIHGHNHKRSISYRDGAHGRIPVVGISSASIAKPTPHGDDLARAHFFSFASGGRDAPARITLVARGWAETGGPIVELERRLL